MSEKKGSRLPLGKWSCCYTGSLCGLCFFGHHLPMAISLLRRMWAIEVHLNCFCVYSSSVLPPAFEHLSCALFCSSMHVPNPVPTCPKSSQIQIPIRLRVPAISGTTLAKSPGWKAGRPGAGHAGLTQGEMMKLI